MRLIKPSFEILSNVDGLKMLNAIESAGRTCYKSEEKITPESSLKFVANIIKRGHESVIEHQSVSVRIICDRGVSHEIVRHRLASYSQESTRYCDYAGGHIAFIIPPWVYQEPGMYDFRTFHGITSENARSWYFCMLDAEKTYKKLRSSGWKPEQARTVLPNSLKTEIVCTMNLRQWRHFFGLRTAKAAHPQMREITIPILAEFKKLIPVIFDDIGEPND